MDFQICNIAKRKDGGIPSGSISDCLALKKELRYEKMRAEALDTMIDVAEEMFNIPVRKKAGTKQ